jgi:hypothetical protein
MESTEAGWANVLFSLTNAADVQWAIMNPLFKPPSFTKNAGNPDKVLFTRRSTRR